MKSSDLTFPLNDQTLLVVLPSIPTGFQHEGVHAWADLSGCDADVVSDTGSEVNPPDGVWNREYVTCHASITNNNNDAPWTFSFSGYFQKARVFPSRTTQRLCQAPKPETSSNIVMKPLLETWTDQSNIKHTNNAVHYLTLAVTV